uniref:Uncharacterized protein n=1 Tax=Chlamydomonas leiostraca TaxID=1034604 RepID=A0A7S0WNH6_9CHLO
MPTAAAAATQPPAAQPGTTSAQAGGVAATDNTELAVRQQGSLEEGELFVTVLMCHGNKQLEAELMLDTGCNMDINMSDYKADQLGLPKPSKRAAPLEMGQKQIGAVKRRGAVETVLLLEGEGGGVLEDPLRSAFLEVWTDVGSVQPSDASNSASSIGLCPPMAEAGSEPLAIQVLSPVRKGKDRHEFDAILGATGMAKLRLGIERDSGTLYVKQRTSLHRV